MYCSIPDAYYQLLSIPNNKGAKVSAKIFVQHFFGRFCPPTKSHNTSNAIIPVQFIRLRHPSVQRQRSVQGAAGKGAAGNQLARRQKNEHLEAPP
jgi:hypothetical protein